MNEEDDFNEEEYLRHLREQVEEIRSRHKDDVCPHGRRNGELCVECGPLWVCNCPIYPLRLSNLLFLVLGGSMSSILLLSVP